MYCTNCGQELNNDARFCSKCGTQLQGVTQGSQSEKIPPQEVEPLPGSEIVCPICKHADRLEKVSTIVLKDTQESTGTSRVWVTGEKTGYWVTVPTHFIRISGLAQALFPPLEPTKKNLSGLVYLIFLFLFISTIPLSCTNDAYTIFPILVIVFFFLALVTHNNNEVSRVKKEKPGWEKAITAWDKLYYCYRDDIAFDNETLQYSASAVAIDRFCRPLMETPAETLNLEHS
jgi:hypothetical protein